MYPGYGQTAIFNGFSYLFLAKTDTNSTNPQTNYALTLLSTSIFRIMTCNKQLVRLPVGQTHMCSSS